MCYACYGFNHTAKSCLRKRSCRKCNKRYPTALHVDNFIPNKVTSYSSANQDTSVATSQSETSHVISSNNTCCAIDSDPGTILHSILPVKVHHKGSGKHNARPNCSGLCGCDWLGGYGYQRPQSSRTSKGLHERRNSIKPFKHSENEYPASVVTCICVKLLQIACPLICRTYL